MVKSTSCKLPSVGEQAVRHRVVDGWIGQERSVLTRYGDLGVGDGFGWNRRVLQFGVTIQTKLNLRRDRMGQADSLILVFNCHNLTDRKKIRSCVQGL